MTIPAAPTVPVPTSSTFATDAYAFTQWQAELGPAIDAETARLNALAFGSYNATSTTSLTIGTGSKSLTVDTGKGYAVGQAVMIASTAGPTNYLTGQVTSYDSGTGALVVNVTSVAGSGTVAAWTVSVAAVVAGGGVSPDSIVVLTSGTSWTCPDGVTKARLRLVGGGGGGGIFGSTGVDGGSGGSGGYVEAIFSVAPSTSYAYAVGSGGGDSSAGGTTTFTANAITYTASGGAGGTSASGGAGGTASGSGAFVANGLRGEGSATRDTGSGAYGTDTPSMLSFYGRGGRGGSTTGTGLPGESGAIILELYK